ncbi:hypothetical protein ACFQY5_23770 [Paeniroseomonas aquatica]|uniref:hypothetical protein n=1 Tax=Paeniroseomonas aquatica TaxID=373043 RepID=UPI003619FD01
MDRYVHSALGPRDRDRLPPGPLLGRALDYVAREEWRAARAVLDRAAEDPAERRRAQYLLWEVCQVLGEPDPAARALRAALREDPVTTRFSPAPRRRILALAAPGDFQANLPLGALLEAPEIELHTLWLTDPATVLRDPAAAFAGPPPAFDCVFIAIAEDPRHHQALAAADRLAAALDVPVINSGAGIAALSRQGVAERLRGLADAVVPPQALLDRAALEAGPALDWPVIIRPEHSHAGQGLARLDGPAALAAYLRRTEAARCHLAPFVDYRSADGHWRKYRIILVDGEPWPCHLAVHDDWTIWYYNARMELAPGSGPRKPASSATSRRPSRPRRAAPCRASPRASASTTAASTAACCPTGGWCCSRSRPA